MPALTSQEVAVSQPQTAPATDRAACVICGESMEGQHHNATAHKVCREKASKDPSFQPVVRPDAPPDAPEAKMKIKDSGVVKIPISGLPEHEDVARVEYWCGTTEECPIQNVTVGGQSFPRDTGTAVRDPSGNIESGHLEHGAMLQLTDTQVDRVVRGVSERLIRWTGQPTDENGKPRGKRRGIIIMRDGPYNEQAGDEPLARYVYMVRTDSLGFRGRMTIPETMLEE